MQLPLLAEFSILDLWRVAWTIWFFVLGGVFGSFLNVAVYRLPAGMNVAYPRSRCPRCGTGIRWYDNVPVLSWLVLGGQCRDCGGPIGIRYPLVEFLTGLVFVLVLSVEGFGNAANLPVRYVGVITGTAGEGIYRANVDNLLEVMLGFHLLLLVTLLAAALIDFEDHPQPLALFLPAWLIGLLLPLWYPLVRPVPWDARVTDFLFSPPWWERNTPLAAAYDALPAVAFVLVTGLLSGIGSLIPGGVNVLARVPSLAPLATVLLFLGWQAALVAACGATVLYLLLWLVGSRVTWSGSLFVTTLVTLLTWSSWDGLMPRAGGPALLAW